MKKFLTLISLSLLAQAVAVQAAGPFKWAPRSKSAPAEWQQPLGAPAHKKSPAKAPKTEADQTLPAAESFGYLDMPDGTTRFIVTEFKKEDFGEPGEYYTDYTITGIKATIYDSNYQPVGLIEDTIELPEGTEKCSQISFGTTVTKKFFNTDDNYEVMMMMSFKPTGTPGAIPYTKVYSVKGADTNASVVTTLPGYYISAINTATDAYGEDFFMEFFSGEQETEDQWLNTFSIYTKASYSNPEASVLKSFTVDMIHTMSDGDNEAMPVTMAANGKNLYVTVAQYEKTFFEDPFNITNDKLSEDNHYIIELWAREGFAKEMTLKKTTSIPCDLPADSEYAMRSYALGMFSYDKDVTFDFTDDGLPAYIISIVDTGWQEGQSSCFFAVYDTDGNIIKTFGKDNQGYLQVSPVAGQPDQYCFIVADADNPEALNFSFVNYPSLDESVRIPATYTDGTTTLNLSNTLDRAAYGAGYCYVFANVRGETDADGNVLQPMVWIDSEGKLIRVDRINGGKNVNIIRPYVGGQVLNPWVFNTDNKQEYLFYVQRLNDSSSSATHTELCVANADGEMLLQYAFDTKDTSINASIVNITTQPAIWLTYTPADKLYHSEFINLPLNKMQGDGTVGNPYLISTIGDMELVKNNLSAHYRITADLDYAGRAFTPITEPFTGSIDGASHTIRNFSLSDASMFKSIAGTESAKASIKDLTLSHVTLDGEADAVLASAMSNAELSNVHVYKADINASGYTFGTLAESTQNAVLSECSAASTTINAPGCAGVGGLVNALGKNSSAVACAFSGEITGKSSVGGIAAEGQSSATVKDCHVNAILKAEYSIGGIIAYSDRSLIERCEVEGEITATGHGLTYTENGQKNMVNVGGIAGYIGLPSSSYDDDYNPIPGTFGTVVKGCVVGLSAINIDEAATDATLLETAHRIAGGTCINEEPEVTGYDPDTWEPIYGDPYGPEPGLVDNYALDDLARIQATVADELTSTEGKSIAYDALDRDLLTNLGWGFFDYTAEKPWVTGTAGLPQLHYEAATGSYLAFNPSMISVVEGEKASVLLEMDNITFDALTINISDEENCTANPVEFDENGNVIFEIEVKALGTYTVTATNGSVTATLTVTGVSGIADVTAADSSSAISYDGTTLRSADGSPVSVYSISGVLMKAPAAEVSVDTLPAGIYIARSAADVLKITVR